MSEITLKQLKYMYICTYECRDRMLLIELHPLLKIPILEVLTLSTLLGHRDTPDVIS